jgi:hypothetical protein
VPGRNEPRHGDALVGEQRSADELRPRDDDVVVGFKRIVSDVRVSMEWPPKLFSERFVRAPEARPSIAAKSQSMPRPGVVGAIAYPSAITSCEVVMSFNCGMYSTQTAFGTAAVSDACSSIRKCGHTPTLNASAQCATLSHGVMPPIRATSTWTMEHASRSRYSRKCAGMVDRFADGDGNRRVRGELGVPGEILRRQRLLEPREAEGLERPRPSDRLRYVETLVRVDHDLERIADRSRTGANPADILGHVRLADLELRAAESPVPLPPAPARPARRR